MLTEITIPPRENLGGRYLNRSPERTSKKRHFISRKISIFFQIQGIDNNVIIITIY